MSRMRKNGYGFNLRPLRGWQWGLVLGLLAAAACTSPEHDRLMREKYPTYPEIMKHAIDRGYPMRDMDHDQVPLALGEPVCKKTIQFKGRPVEVWLFPPPGRDPCVSPDFRVYFENGVVTGWEDFRTAPVGTIDAPVHRGDNPYATGQ